jgi:hypothetical protein
MNESMVHQAARAVKLISDSLRIPSVAEENERLYAEDEFRLYRVPVTLTREGFVTVRSRNATSAENIARVMASFAEDIENAIQSESVGEATEIQNAVESHTIGSAIER